MKPASGETVAVEALARGVGVLVRQGRTRHGLTRRGLAAATGISERYLAQLEAGAANVSLNLLARIGAALGVSIHALIPAEAAAGGVHKKGIALIGLRGAGKTTLGERLAGGDRSSLRAPDANHRRARRHGVGRTDGAGRLRGLPPHGGGGP